MFSTLRKKAVAATAVVGSALTAGVANAQETTGIDVTEAVSILSDVNVSLVSIGGTLIGLAALAVGFKWVKGMIFS